MWSGALRERQGLPHTGDNEVLRLRRHLLRAGRVRLGDTNRRDVHQLLLGNGRHRLRIYSSRPRGDRLFPSRAEEAGVTLAGGDQGS